MPTPTKFQPWVEFMTEGANVGSDQFAMALTNVLPSVTNGVLADISEIVYTGISSRLLTTTSATQTGGIQQVTFADLVLTASATTAAFQWASLYDDTLPGDPLVWFLDLGSPIIMSAGQTLTFDFSGPNMRIQ